MAANRRRLVHRLQAGDPLDLPASRTIIPPWKDKAWQGLAGLTVICRYHSFYSAPLGAVAASDELDPAQTKGVARLEVHEGGWAGLKLEYQYHWGSERTDEVQKHLGSSRKL